MKKQPQDFGYNTWFTMYRMLVMNGLITPMSKPNESIKYSVMDKENNVITEYTITLRTLQRLCFKELETAFTLFNQDDAYMLEHIVSRFMSENYGQSSDFENKVRKICNIFKSQFV